MAVGQVTDMRPTRIKPDRQVDFRRTPGERNLISERTFIDAALEERLQAERRSDRDSLFT